MRQLQLCPGWNISWPLSQEMLMYAAASPKDRRRYPHPWSRLLQGMHHVYEQFPPPVSPFHNSEEMACHGWQLSILMPPAVCHHAELFSLPDSSSRIGNLFGAMITDERRQSAGNINGGGIDATCYFSLLFNDDSMRYNWLMHDAHSFHTRMNASDVSTEVHVS